MQRVCQLQFVSATRRLAVVAAVPNTTNVTCSQKSLLSHRHEQRVYLATAAMQYRNFSSTPTSFAFWGSSKKETTSTPSTPGQQVGSESVSSSSSSGVDLSSIPSPPEIPTETSAVNTMTGGYIPEPPPIIDESVVMNALGEPTLNSLGLASSYTPTGWMQNLMEMLHVQLDLPWWQTLSILAVIIRLALFPVVIKAQKNAVFMRKIGPELAHYQEKIEDAKITGDQLQIARAMHDFMEFRKTSGFKLTTMLTPLMQAPFFISAFLGIRNMCNLPVESLQTGGILWFTDLTIADPYFILPILASSSILLMIHRGVDVGVAAANMSPNMRIAFYGFGLISFPFFIFLPSGVMAYVCTSNIISLGTQYLVNTKKMKKVFGIPELSEFDELRIKETQKKQKDQLAKIYKSYKDSRMLVELKEREKLMERQFKQAGTTAPPRTYKENPLRQQQQQQKQK